MVSTTRGVDSAGLHKLLSGYIDITPDEHEPVAYFAHSPNDQLAKKAARRKRIPSPRIA